MGTDQSCKRIRSLPIDLGTAGVRVDKNHFVSDLVYVASRLK